MEISYKTEGLRSLRSMDYFEFKPVTILVGLNNSGKSTLLRSLPLLKQSLESELVSPIDWSGKYVDFCDFATTLGRKNKQNEITFSFKFSVLPLDDEYSNNLESSFARENTPLLSCLYPELVRDSVGLRDVCFTITVSGDENKSHISKLDICIGSLNMESKIAFSADGSQIDYVEVGNKRLSEIINYDRVELTGNSLFSEDIYFRLNSIENKNDKMAGRVSSLFNLIKNLNEIIQEGTSIDESRIIPRSKSKLIDNISKSTNKNFIRNSDRYFEKIPMAEKAYLEELGKIHLLWFTYSRISATVNDLLTKLNYVAPARSGNYRNTKFMEVRHLDSSGSNLPNFLNCLESKHQKGFSKWVKKLCGFGVEIERKNGFINLLVKFGNERINVDDSGFGIAKLLPVLTNIWCAMYRPVATTGIRVDLPHVPRIITIEQPELHLHSQQQANIADAIVSVLTEPVGNKTPRPRFIVETHSEKMLSRFSTLIYGRRLNHEDIQVALFTSKNPVKPFESNVEVFPFNERGKLKNFPIVFFNSRAN